jgi:hypothetical protein
MEYKATELELGLNLLEREALSSKSRHAKREKFSRLSIEVGMQDSLRNALRHAESSSKTPVHGSPEHAPMSPRMSPEELNLDFLGPTPATPQRIKKLLSPVSTSPLWERRRIKASEFRYHGGDN